MKAAVAWWGPSRPGRAWKRYSNARGSILAAGMGYFAFFSIFPAVALAFAVFGFVLRARPDLLRSIVDQLSAYLPGLVKDAQHPQGLIPIQAPPALALSVTGVIAFVALVLAGLGWLGATREGIRTVFGVPRSAGNLIADKLRDLGVLFTLGLGIALFALLTSVVGAAAGWISHSVGLSGEAWILFLADFVVSVLADTALMILLLRVVSGVLVPWRDLFQGALVGGFGLSLLKISAAVLLPRLTSNPLFASFAIVVGLLVWLNLIARLTLISAAWAADDVNATHAGGSQARAELLSREPVAVSSPGPAAVRDGTLPAFGARSGDRTTVVSGVVLGAAAMAVTAVVARGIRSVVRITRG